MSFISNHFTNMENFDVIYEHEINCIRSFENVLEAIRGIMSLIVY